MKDLTKAFSVDAVSDMFFDGYKKQYEDIIQYITGKRMVKVANKWEEQIKNDPCEEIMQEFAHFPNPEKAVRDYVKKLMGRLVFLQFLQKKGWLGVPAGAEWGTGDAEFIQTLFAQCQDKDHFIDNVLEPLFNDLNTEREGDNCQLSIVNCQFKVPYLNGGLFERDATDETEFPLPAKYMQSLLDFFASYNFTIDENDPDDAEVGVDPEMLGRIFENLLEDNKDKGVFYTPKEIVSYMCRESLIAYLQTDIEDEPTKEAIRQFVTTHDKTKLSAATPLPSRGGAGVGFVISLSSCIDQRLKDVKICDPAIGSGAFPMGLLKELFQCRTALEGITQSKAAEIKKHIIQQNIYGVDIERGAVDIARLRFWLSLIVDEETPQALPNLDYKIVEGNSLITTFDGQYIDLSTNIGMSRLRSSLVRIRPEKKALQAEQKRFFTLSGDEKYRSEIAIKNHILNIIWYQLDYEKHSWEDATVEQAGLFGTTTTKGRKKNAAQVVEFTQERQTVLAKCEKLMAELNDESKSLQERANITIPFFEWVTIFSDIFDSENKNGFDIVIANPPYVDSETMTKNMPELRNRYSNIYQTACGNWDMFIIFIELGMNLLKTKGVLCKIIPNKLIAAKYGQELRNYIAKKEVIEVRDYSRIDVFTNAAVYPITIIMRNSDSEVASHFTIMDDINRVRQTNETTSHSLKEYDNWDLFFAETKIFNLINKINNHPRLFNMDVDILGAATVADAYEIKKLVEEEDSTHLGFKLINSGTIDPYQPLWGIKTCRYIKGGYLKPIVSKDKLQQYSRTRYQQANSSKIVVASMTIRYEAYLDIDGNYIAGKSTTIILGPIDELYYYIGIINSKLASFWLNITFNSLKMSGEAINVGRNELGLLPIPKKQFDFKQIINRIMEEKKYNPSADTSALESEIDRLVYQLYGLTEEEIKIVEQS
ncbi:MAG: Eco57I restriction-modification methylase domain-containing protein [Prevotella sp.]|nr:Eco57I restriction-modification methylase domain-containing protein [Prevotella sp.]